MFLPVQNFPTNVYKCYGCTVREKRYGWNIYETTPRKNSESERVQYSNAAAEAAIFLPEIHEGRVKFCTTGREPSHIFSILLGLWPALSDEVLRHWSNINLLFVARTAEIVSRGRWHQPHQFTLFRSAPGGTKRGGFRMMGRMLGWWEGWEQGEVIERFNRKELGTKGNKMKLEGGFWLMGKENAMG